MALNTYGLKMIGIKKASQETVNWDLRSGGYTEIFYDMSDGEVWTKDQISLGQNSWTVYDSESIIKICNTTRHLTMQEIADLIYGEVTRRMSEK